MADDQERNRPTIQSIQLMRAIAALSVMTMHICGYTSDVVGNFHWKELAALTKSFGHSGVDLFFVISGVIMYIITRGSHDNNISAASKFITHRIFRIYPLFWITLLFSTLALGKSLEPLLSVDGLKSLMLYVAPELHPVSWTLRYEVRFYLVVAIFLLVLRKNLDLAFIVWGLGQFVASTLYMSGLIEENYFNYVLMTEFSMGLLVGALITRSFLYRPIALLSLSALWAVLSSVAIYYTNSDIVTQYRHLLFGIPAALAVYATVTLEQGGLFKPSTRLCKLGDISYSIYLWHYALILYVAQRWVVTGHDFFDGFMFAITVASLTLCLSVASFLAIEKPCIQLGRLLTRPREANARGAPVKRDKQYL